MLIELDDPTILSTLNQTLLLPTPTPPNLIPDQHATTPHSISTLTTGTTPTITTNPGIA